MVTTLDSEFARTGLADRGHWHATTGLHGDVRHELQAFTADEVSVERGTGLVLKTERRAFLDHPFSSGQVTTEGLFSQTYGHFEMMAKMPQANGIWPAFWLMPIVNGWPPEIDVVEYIFAPWGHLPSRLHRHASNPQTTLHWRDSAGVPSQAGQGFHSDIDLFPTYEDWATTPPLPGSEGRLVGYHDYAIDWRPGSLVWFIDGQPVFCLADDAMTGARVPSQPMYMIIDDAVVAGTPQHPGWPGFIRPDEVFPQKLAVAFVKVASFKDLPKAPRGPLEIRNVTPSTTKARPGEAVELSAEVLVGNNDLDGRLDGQFTIRSFDPTQYSGIGHPVDTVGVHLTLLKAGHRYPLRANYVVRKDMVSGLYSLGLSVNSRISQGSTASRPVHVELTQGEVIAVTNSGTP